MPKFKGGGGGGKYKSKVGNIIIIKGRESQLLEGGINPKGRGVAKAPPAPPDYSMNKTMNQSHPH